MLLSRGWEVQQPGQLSLSCTVDTVAVHYTRIHTPVLRAAPQAAVQVGIGGGDAREQLGIG